MDNTNPEKKKSPKESIKPTYALKKVDQETAKLIRQCRERANKKTYGRKVRDGEVIAKAMSLLEQQHIQELQESTLSEKDRLHMAHESYMKHNGKISLDQFIGRLLKGEVKAETL